MCGDSSCIRILDGRRSPEWRLANVDRDETRWWWEDILIMLNIQEL
jgi:hypothetical protein